MKIPKVYLSAPPFWGCSQTCSNIPCVCALMFSLKHKLPRHAYLWLGSPLPISIFVFLEADLSRDAWDFHWPIPVVQNDKGCWHPVAAWLHYRCRFCLVMLDSCLFWREACPELRKWPYHRQKRKLPLCPERRLCRPWLFYPVRLWGASWGQKTPAWLRAEDRAHPLLLPSLYPSSPPPFLPPLLHLLLPPP